MATKSIKRILGLFAVVLAVVLATFCCVACSNSNNEDDYGLSFQANEDKKTCRLIGIGDCTEKTIVIPSVYKGMTVTSIYRNAFSGASLESVTVPGTVEEIGDGAFKRCQRLKKVVIQEGATSIGTSCFEDCTELTEVVLPSTIKTVGTEILNGCTSIKKLTVPFVGSSTRAENGEALFGYFFGETEFGEATKTKQEYKSGFSVAYYIPKSLREVTVLGGKIGYGAFSNCGEIIGITIGQGVSVVNKRAFYNCTSLLTVDIEEGVTNIMNEAFSGCGSLSAVVLPDSLTNIGSETFAKCTALESVTLGAGLRNIGERCFRGCAEIKELTIKDGVAKIETEVFYGCTGIKTLDIPGSVESIGLRAFGTCTGLESVTFNHGTTRILESAFYGCSSLKSLDLGDTVSSIGKSAFSGCSELAELKLSAKLDTIGANAFKDCSSLTEIELPASVSSIGLDAFSGCESLAYFNYLGDVNSWVSTKFGSYASNPLEYTGRMYIKGELLTKVEGLTVNHIYNYAFVNCRSLLSVTIPAGFTSADIDSEAFIDCSKLVEVVNKSDIELIIGDRGNGYVARYAKSIVTSNGESGLFDEGGFTWLAGADGDYYLVSYNGDATELTLPDSVRGAEYQLCQYAFSYNQFITKISLGDGVTAVSNSAFYYCVQLKEVEFGANVTEIGDYAFNCCYSLTTVDIPDSVTVIGNGAFKNCKGLTTVVVGKGVTEMPEGVFSGCGAIKEMTLPFAGASRTNSDENWQNHFAYIFGTEDFDGAEAVYLWRKNNQNNQSRAGGWWDDEDYAKYYETAYMPAELTKVTISDSDINDYGFYRVSIIKSVIVVNATRIGINAFSRCSHLESIELPDTLKEIGFSAFNRCFGLSSISFPDSLVTLGTECFANCSNLSTLTLPKNIENIPQHGFSECSSLLSVVIPEKVVSIEVGAFYECRNLVIVVNKSSLDIQAGSTTHGMVAYYAMLVTDDENESGKTEKSGDFTYMVFGEKVYLTSYDGEATDLVLEKYNGKSYVIYNKAFAYCAKLQTLTIKEGVTEIGNQAFAGCYYLKKVVIGSCVERIGANAFGACVSLTELVLSEGLTYIGDEAFYMTSIVTLTIPDSVTEIGGSMVKYCFDLRYVVLGSGIKTIADSAFIISKSNKDSWGDDSWGNRDRSNLTSIYYRGTEQDWEKVEKGDNLYGSKVTLYYYSETKVDAPAEGVYYWHYENGSCVAWNTPPVDDDSGDDTGDDTGKEGKSD